MRKFYTLSLGFFLFYNHLFSANELYINGSNSVLTTATLFDSTCVIFVNGEVINQNGLFINSGGSIELTGNWTNTVPDNKYQSTGTEKFYGTAEQTISGTMNGTTKSAAGYDNQFYNLKVYRNSTITTTPGKYITLNTNVNIANILDFESATPNSTYAGSGTNEAVIRTDPSSPSNVGVYAYEVYVRNPSTTAITGYAAISGNGQDLYIEGKLRRQVNAATSYDFPIGFKPTYKDGMEGYRLTFNSAPTSKSVLGYIEDPTAVPSTRYVLCDIGKDPGAGVQTFPSCIGGPDGLYDLYYLDASTDLTHEWVANASDAVGTINYNFTAYPGYLLDDVSKYYQIPAACANPYQTKLLRVMAKDGIVGGNLQTGPGSYTPFYALSSFIWCSFTDAGVLPITLPTQTSFSKFRIHGTSLFSSSSLILSVALANFTITPVNNQYFQLDWKTLSELNNYGFEIERSADGLIFSTIGFVPGNGTSNAVHLYTLDDRDVTGEIDYYYRLKIIDHNGAFKYSKTVTGRLKGGNAVIVSDFYPNPATDNIIANVYSPTGISSTFCLYDVLGQVVIKKSVELKNGWNKLELNTSMLAPATYIATFSYKDGEVTKKIIKK